MHFNVTILREYSAAFAGTPSLQLLQRVALRSSPLQPRFVSVSRHTTCRA